MKTAEEIVAIAEKKSDTVKGQRTIINALYNRQDESHLWPVRNRFDATKRAIRRVCAFERAYGILSNLEYAYAIDKELSDIVNNCY